MERRGRSAGRGAPAQSPKVDEKAAPQAKPGRRGRRPASAKQSESTDPPDKKTQDQGQSARQKASAQNEQNEQDTDTSETGDTEGPDPALGNIADACQAMHALTFLCELTGQDPPEPITPKPGIIEVEERPSKLTPDDYERMFFGAGDHRKHGKKQKIKYTPVNTDYNKWKHMGRSYLISPEPEPLGKEPDLVDFICNSVYKVLATGGEGDAGKDKDEDDHNPIPWIFAQLNLSMKIDELGIDHLKAEHRELRAAKHAPATPEAVTEIANSRNRINRLIREFNDDRACIYRQNPGLPERDFTGVKFFGVKMDQLHFLTYMVVLVEHSSMLTPPPPNHRIHIAEVMYAYIPLLFEVCEHQDMDVHMVVPASHVAFVYRLFELLNRLDEYFSCVKFISLRATFGALKLTRADRTVILPREVTKLFANIEAGGSLSRMFCEVRNLAIVLKCNDAKALVDHCRQFVRAGNNNVPEMIGSLVADFPCQEPNLLKFVFTDGVLRPVAVENTYKWTAPAPNAFPSYPLLRFQRCHRGFTDQVGVYSAGDLIFTVAPPQQDPDAENMFGFVFKPNTRSTTVCLTRDVV